MLVRLAWPHRDQIAGKRGGSRQDAYWVECSADESLPLLAGRTDDPQVPLETLGWGRTTPYPMEHQIFYFLVARDGSSIVPFRGDYPTSSEWQGRSPFVRVGPFDIRDISELADLPALPANEIPLQRSRGRVGARKAFAVIASALGRRRRH